jgi:hypothetical protein
MEVPDDIETIGEAERTILRDLAGRVAEVACLPIQERRRKQWKQHNSLASKQPMIWLSPEGSWRELVPETSLRCEGKNARQIEGQLRRTLYYHDHFCDDNLVEKTWIVRRAIVSTGWGLEPQWHWSREALGARAFKPVVHEPADLKKIRFPEIHEDTAQTGRQLAAAQDLFGDILDVQLRGVLHVSFHMMAQYTALRGLEQVMMDMIENPGWLHEAMALLTEGNRRLLQQYADQNLLSLNNDWTYQNSGGNGYTDELPAPGFDPKRVRPCDMWASAESQELAQVSPAMHEDFALRYERPLLEPFGLNGYGCCEDLSRKMDDVLKIKNIRRISISPFADVDRCAEKLGNKAIYSWKPHPSHLVGMFDEDRVRAYIRHTLEVTRANGCVVEMILKDTHTCENHPERFDAWCRIARQEVEQFR